MKPTPIKTTKLTPRERRIANLHNEGHSLVDIMLMTHLKMSRVVAVINKLKQP